MTALAPASTFVAMKGNAVKSVPLSAASELLVRPSTAGVDLTEQAVYQNVPWVYRCIEIRAHSVSSIPFTLEGTSAGIDVDKLQRGIPEMLRRVEASLCEHGAAYMRKRVNGFGVITEFQWLSAQTMRPIYDEQQGIKAYERTLNGKRETIPASEVLAFFLPDPDVEVGPGTSPAAVCLKVAGIVANSNEFALGFFERGALNVTLLVVDPTVSEPELKRLEAWWKKLARGVQRAWETIAVRKSVEPKTLGYAPEQLAMPELKAMARNEVANAFGIPEAMLTQSANYASAREHRLAYWNDTVVPEAQYIEAQFNEQIFLPLGLKMSFHYEALSVFQKDEAEEIAGVIQLYEAGLISLNEARARLGLDPVGQDTVPGLRPNDQALAGPTQLAPKPTASPSSVSPNAVSPGAQGKPNNVAVPMPTTGAQRSYLPFDTSGAMPLRSFPRRKDGL